LDFDFLSSTFNPMTITPKTRPSNWFILFIILLALGGLLRLLDITDPPLDFQPSRQLRNSLVARDIYYSIPHGHNRAA
jgi:hypothetical protein